MFTESPSTTTQLDSPHFNSPQLTSTLLQGWRFSLLMSLAAVLGLELCSSYSRPGGRPSQPPFTFLPPSTQLNLTELKLFLYPPRNPLWPPKTVRTPGEKVLVLVVFCYNLINLWFHVRLILDSFGCTKGGGHTTLLALEK